MMKKKVYIQPLMAVMQLEAQAILAGSNGTDQSGSKVNDPFYVDPGDNTGRTRQTLWGAKQMLTQNCCQTIHDCQKVVSLHYESEWQYKYV